ncbi:MAG: hypothetical protein ACRCY3_13090 [Sphingorhabdus sp.]
MTDTQKTIVIILLLLIGFHLLLYGYLRRRIADAKRKELNGDR